MKRKTLANLLLASAALPFLAKKNKGSSNSCPFCVLGTSMSYREMHELVQMCDYHLDDNVLQQIMRQDFNLLKGSANIAKRAKEGLISAGQTSLTKDQFAQFQRMVDKFPTLYPELAESLLDLLAKLKPYEFRLLANMGLSNSKANYFFAKSMIQMSRVIGSRNFINRYLQRTALVVPNTIVISPLFQKKEAWLTDWICTRRNRNLGTEIERLTTRVNRMGLDFNEQRVTFMYDKDKEKYLDEQLPLLDSLKLMAEVAWFLEVAKQVGVTKGVDLLFTYPVENIFTGSRFSSEIGDTVFGKVTYKLHVPSGDDGYPQTEKAFTKSYRNEVVEDSRLSQPYLYLYQQGARKPCSIVYYSYTAGSGSIIRTPMFTHTTKMNAISFSIPAGAPQYGGSCISSAYEATGPNQNNTICRGCYALKGNYMYIQYVYSSAPRMNWLIETVQQDAVGEKLAYFLALAIESYARYGRGSTRNLLEFGVIEKGHLMYAVGKSKRAILPAVPMRIGGTSQDWIDFSSDNEVAGYFRLHDSGDFTISSKAHINQRYINAWGEVASVFPQVKFWAPTRNWTTGYGNLEHTITINDKTLQAALADIESGIGKQVFDKLGLSQIATEAKSLWTVYVTWLNTICELNPNLIIRPSGLTVITPFNRQFIKVPVIDSLTGFKTYLSAGTGVNAVFKLAKSTPRWIFTMKAFDTIAFEEAYPPGVVGRNEIRAVIGKYLKGYFLKQYNRTSGLPTASYVTALSMDGQPVWQCPVNLKTDVQGKAIVSADSCLGSNCRFCWLEPSKPVTYGAH